MPHSKSFNPILWKFPKNRILVCLFFIISLVTLTLDMLGRVDNTDKTTDATLKTIKINVGHTKNELEILSSFGTRLDKATEIIIAFTDSKIFALVSAMALSSIWFFSVTRNIVSTPRPNLFDLSLDAFFDLILSILASISKRFNSFSGCHLSFAESV